MPNKGDFAFSEGPETISGRRARGNPPDALWNAERIQTIRKTWQSPVWHAQREDGPRRSECLRSRLSTHLPRGAAPKMSREDDKTDGGEPERKPRNT